MHDRVLLPNGKLRFWTFQRYMTCLYCPESASECTIWAVIFENFLGDDPQTPSNTWGFCVLPNSCAPNFAQWASLWMKPRPSRCYRSGVNPGSRVRTCNYTVHTQRSGSFTERRGSGARGSTIINRGSLTLLLILCGGECLFGNESKS